MNDQIRISPVRVIDQDQNQIGIISISEALAMAREAGLDLVEVSPMERPPVCRVMDYGRQKYLQKKKQKISQGAHTMTIKEIRLRPKTDPHDRSIKVERARKFLEAGSRVQFTMLFRGRERVHRDSALEALREIVEGLGELCKIEREPSMEGRRMTMMVAPGKPTGTQTKSAGGKAKVGDGRAKPVGGQSQPADAPPAQPAEAAAGQVEPARALEEPMEAPAQDSAESNTLDLA